MFARFISVTMLLIATIILFVYTFISGKSNRNKTWRAHVLMASASIEVLFYFLFVINKNPAVAYPISAVSYCAMDTTLFFLLRFVTEFTNIRKRYDSKLLWLKAIIGIDCVLLIVNIFTQFYYSCEIRSSFTMEYMRIVKEPIFNIHAILTEFMVFASITILIYKLVTSSRIYIRKYGILLAQLVAMVILNMLFNTFEWAVDYAVLLAALVALWIYHVQNKYIPSGLVANATRTLADGLSDALIIVDNDDNCIYVNEPAEKTIGMHVGDLDGDDILHEWCGGKLCKNTSDFTKYVEVPDNLQEGKMRQFRLVYKRMINESQRYEGSYFQLRDLTEEINHIEQDKFRATHDSLTKLYNKERFMQLCRGELLDNPQKDYYMIMLDIANFKFVNDLFGPQMGDKVLIQIGEQLDKRAYPGDIYARLENDHFGIFMEKKNFKEEEFLKGAEDISKIINEINFPLTIYTGVYEITDKSLPISVMCDRAHMALDNIKGNDGQLIARYTDKIRADRLKRQDIVSGLDQAIADGEIQIFLQAQTDKDGVSKGAEALVRWIHPDGSMVFPNDFIPVLEETGAIARLDMRVWELACQKLKEWDEAGYTDYYISVNISAKDFYYIDLYKCFTSLTDRYGVDRGRLHLEITETAIMKNENHQIDVIDKLKEAGFLLEMDDFGSGYSSLNMLKDIVVDVLKIDMAFLSKADDDMRSRSILKLIVDMAHDLNMDIIIEGVETHEQLHMLTNFGCETFQGYYFSRPIKVSEYEERFMHVKSKDF